MAEKDWIATVKDFLLEQLSGINNNVLYVEDVGGVKYEFVLEFPDDIPTKTGISGSEIVDINKTLDNTIVNVQRVFPDGEVIIDYSFNAKGKGGDVQALENFNKILKEGKGMKGVLLEYYDTFPVETTLPTTLENDITIPNTPEGIDTPTNVAGAEVIDEIEGIQRETIEKLRNANDAFVAEQVDDIMARKINEVLPFVDTSLSRAEAIGISTTGPQITTSADPVLNTFIDEIEKITGQNLDIKDKRKLRQFLYDVAKGNDNLINDKKLFIPDLKDGVDNSKLKDPGYKIWKNWQHSGAFREKNITGMTLNEITAFGPPDYVYLVEGLEKSGENINFTAISDAGVNIPDTPTNVVDDLAKQNELIDNFVNSIKTEGNLEFYVKHSGTTVGAGDIKYNPTIGKGSQIPGFYTEPLGIRDIKVMGGTSGADAVSNYYKVQVNSNNLLVDAISGQVTGTQSPITGVGKMYLGDQINKIDWNIFEQETGLNFERDFVGANKDPLIPTYEIKNGKKFTRLDVQTFIRNLESKGLTGDQIASALRKSGIEGFATGPINAQYEIVLIDPNDDLGIGSKLNIEDATEVEFLNNQSKVNKIDELVIAPTTVVDDVVQPSVIDDAIELVDNLNIDNVVKKEITEKLAKVGGQAAGQIPIPGVGQAIDFWETTVLVVGAALLAAGEVDELPKVVQNFGIDLYNGFLSSLNIPFTPVEKVEYTPNTDRIIKGLDIIDKLQPTSYAINPVIEEFQEIEATTPTMELPGFGTVPASKYYQPPIESTPERDNINSIMTNLMTNISNAQAAYPITASELSNFQRNPIQVVPSNSADKPEKVEYDSKEKQNLHDIYANMFTSLSESMMR